MLPCAALYIPWSAVLGRVDTTAQAIVECCRKQRTSGLVGGLRGPQSVSSARDQARVQEDLRATVDSRNAFSPADLLSLPPREREVLLRLTRGSPASAEALPRSAHLEAGCGHLRQEE